MPTCRSSGTPLGPQDGCKIFINTWVCIFIVHCTNRIQNLFRHILSVHTVQWKQYQLILHYRKACMFPTLRGYSHTIMNTIHYTSFKVFEVTVLTAATVNTVNILCILMCVHNLKCYHTYCNIIWHKTMVVENYGGFGGSQPIRQSFTYQQFFILADLLCKAANPSTFILPKSFRMARLLSKNILPE